jgi:sugar phosphate isomerase/epimerase
MDLAIAELAGLGSHWIEPAYIKGYVSFDETAFAPASARVISSLLATNNVGVIAVSAHMDLGGADAAPMLERRIQFAADIGAKQVITNATTRQQAGNAREAIMLALPLLERSGITLALENPGHGSGNLLERGSDFAGLIGTFRSPHVRANFDVGNCFTYHGETLDPLVMLAEVLPFASHVHAKDILSANGNWKFTAIGTGSINYTETLSILNRTAPDLPIGIELPLRLDRTSRRDPIRLPSPLPLSMIREAVINSITFVTAN